MKIILSRKGFDAAHGGCASPILPDGTLLSLPIPSEDAVRYEELGYGGYGYGALLGQLNPKGAYARCHVDPDLRGDIRLAPVPGWKPAFGQIGAAQGVLANAGVEVGDLFLFFGWFRQVEVREGKLRYVRKNPADFYHSADLHIIYGYMEIGAILTDPAAIAAFPWHPHAAEHRLSAPRNALYLPAERLSLLPERPGYGVLDFREDRVLTMEGRNRGTWRELDFLCPQHVYGHKKNAAKGGGLYYQGVWQELVVRESENLLSWVKSILN